MEFKTIPKLKIALEESWGAAGVKAKKEMAKKRKGEEGAGGEAKKVKGDDAAV